MRFPNVRKIPLSGLLSWGRTPRSCILIWGQTPLPPDIRHTCSHTSLTHNNSVYIHVTHTHCGPAHYSLFCFRALYFVTFLSIIFLWKIAQQILLLFIYLPFLDENPNILKIPHIINTFPEFCSSPWCHPALSLAAAVAVDVVVLDVNAWVISVSLLLLLFCLLEWRRHSFAFLDAPSLANFEGFLLLYKLYLLLKSDFWLGWGRNSWTCSGTENGLLQPEGIPSENQKDL